MTAHFDDPDFAARYRDGPSRFVPGYRTMQQMAAQLLFERAGPGAEILVLGAGGGLELEAFASTHPDWRFAAIDPSAEMINQAKLYAQSASGRVEWTCGYVADAPRGPFQGATCLLTLHFVPDDGAKLDTLQEIRRRLAPGAAFALVDLCLDKSAADYDHKVGRYGRFAMDSGAPGEDVERTCERLRTVLETVAPERNVELLAEAGFSGTELFYAGLSWRGWVAYA